MAACTNEKKVMLQYMVPLQFATRGLGHSNSVNIFGGAESTVGMYSANKTACRSVSMFRSHQWAPPHNWFG